MFCTFKKSQYLCTRNSEMDKQQKLNIAEWSSW